jgi:uncharacterized membrane protein
VTWPEISFYLSMKSVANLAGHPLHPIFVTIPLGLWSFAPICDLVFHLGWGGDSWKHAAFYCIGGGIAGAVPAIITGLMDYTAIRDPKAIAVAKFHLALNVVVTCLYGLSFFLRWREFPGPYAWTPVVIGFAGVVLLGASGWLGGELVSRFAISVRGSDDVGRGASA